MGELKTPHRSNIKKMNQYKKRHTILRRNLETGVIEGYLGKPYYKWSEHFLYFQTTTKHEGIDERLRRDIFWFKHEEKHQLGELKHEYFVTRLNSKKCPINTNKNIGNNRDPYGVLLRFTNKQHETNNSRRKENKNHHTWLR